MASAGVGVAVMQTGQDGHRNDPTLDSIRFRQFTINKPRGNPLLDALVGTMLIVVDNIFCDNALQLSLAKDEELI